MAGTLDKNKGISKLQASVETQFRGWAEQGMEILVNEGLNGGADKLLKRKTPKYLELVKKVLELLLDRPDLEVEILLEELGKLIDQPEDNISKSRNFNKKRDFILRVLKRDIVEGLRIQNAELQTTIEERDGTIEGLQGTVQLYAKEAGVQLDEKSNA